MALLCVCFGLRISEALALKWSDVDWLNGRLRVERGIVCQVVDDVKTSESRRALHIDNDMLDTLKLWKQASEFSGLDDWMFASPVQFGRLPWILAATQDSVITEAMGDLARTFPDYASVNEDSSGYRPLV